MNRAMFLGQSDDAALQQMKAIEQALLAAFKKETQADMPDSVLVGLLAWVWAVARPSWPTDETGYTGNFFGLPARGSYDSWAALGEHLFGEAGIAQPQGYDCPDGAASVGYADRIFSQQIRLCVAKFESLEEGAVAFAEAVLASPAMVSALNAGDAGALATVLLTTGIYGGLGSDWQSWALASEAIVKAGYEAWRAVRQGPPPKGAWGVKTAPEYFYRGAAGVELGYREVGKEIMQLQAYTSPGEAPIGAVPLSQILAFSRVVANLGMIDNMQTFNFGRLTLPKEGANCPLNTYHQLESDQCVVVYPGPWAGAEGLVKGLQSQPDLTMTLFGGDAGKLADKILTMGIVGAGMAAAPTAEAWRAVADALALSANEAAAELGGEPGALVVTDWRPSYAKEAAPEKDKALAAKEADTGLSMPAMVLIGTAVVAVGAYAYMNWTGKKAG